MTLPLCTDGCSVSVCTVLSLHEEYKQYTHTKVPEIDCLHKVSVNKFPYCKMKMFLCKKQYYLRNGKTATVHEACKATSTLEWVGGVCITHNSKLLCLNRVCINIIIMYEP